MLHSQNEDAYILMHPLYEPSLFEISIIDSLSELSPLLLLLHFDVRLPKGKTIKCLHHSDYFASLL